jgi:hypothetical protein
MSNPLCQLCNERPAIQNSHVIPAFVFRAIKSDSPTGFFRNPNKPNQRVQDGDKLELLCMKCEQLFANAEREFSEKIFSAFHTTDQNQFSYGPWLHYFMTSLAWRTLILDLSGLQVNPNIPRTALGDLAIAAETMRKYLKGAASLGPLLCTHAVAFTNAHSGSADLKQAGANIMIRRSVFGDTVVDKQSAHSAILHNLAGFMCFVIVKGNPRDTWYQTKIDPRGGEIKQPQRVSSWLIGELLGCIAESAQKQDAMSENQQNKVRRPIQNNLAAPALRFREMDKRFVISNDD